MGINSISYAKKITGMVHELRLKYIGTEVVIIVFFLFILSFKVSFAQNEVIIPKTSVAPVIDGEYDQIWDSLSYYNIENLYGGSIIDSSDLSVSWKAMWDSENLYFFVKVKDDSLFNLGSGASKFWIHDCVEIFFDLLNDKDASSTDDSSDDDNYQYRFIWNLDNEPVYENPPFAGVVNKSFTRVVDSKTVGYNIEIKFPWETLIQNHPFGSVINGKKIGLEIKAADLDKSSVPAGVWWPDAELLWNNDTKDSLKISSHFGTFILANTFRSDYQPPSIVDQFTSQTIGARSVQLEWEAPNDVNTELVKEYDVRYSLDSLVLVNWVNAIQASNEPKPIAPGTIQNLVIDSLPPGTKVYFSIKSIDYSGNISGASIIVHTTTFDPDIIPPGIISNLSIDSIGAYQVKIAWTAPGDDGFEGTIQAYDIRYSKTVISEITWVDAIPAMDIPDPLAAGNGQEMIVKGLQQNETYYFAIKSIDEEPNISGISNILELRTLSFSYKAKTTIDQFLGTNSFIDVPIDKMEAVGYIREYHPWTFTEIEDGVFEYNRWNGYWDFDKYYKELNDAGIMVCPVLWSCPSWIQPNPTNKPVDNGGVSTDPGSYKKMARFVFQFAARYGSTVVDEDKLFVNTGQVKKSGLNIIKYFEDWNEQDRTWDGPDAYFSPEEYAAMASANVDGHAGTLGADLGIKTADPNAKFVMGGTAGIEVAYVSDMYDWFVNNRPDHKWPIDVINMHHYAYTWEKNGISPEEGDYKGKVMEVVNWRNANVPDNEIWITEFGYDSNDESPNRINPFGGFDQLEIQAHWNVRTFLILASAGIDRAAHFMIRDENHRETEPRWNDCGLTGTKESNYAPKTSWYYVYSMKNILKTMRFDTVIAENANAWVYKFRNDTLKKEIYALWSPTSAGTESVYRLNLPEIPAKTTLIELADGETEGIRTVLNLTTNQLNVNVSERPVFIEADYSQSTGIMTNDFENNMELVLFPNPAIDHISLGLSDRTSSGDMNILIFDILGKLVLQKTGIEFHSEEYVKIDISGLKSGVYSIVVKNKKELTVKSFIKYENY